MSLDRPEAWLAAAAVFPSLKDQLLTGAKLGDTTYKVHLDGYDNTALWTALYVLALHFVLGR